MILDNDLILIRSQMFEVCFIIYFNALNALLAVTVVIGIVRYSRIKLSDSLNICLPMLHY